MRYTKDNPLRVFEAFAGYGSQSLALKRLKEHYPEFDYIPVGISEIEPAAIKAYKALHGDVKNFGDICKIDWDEVPDFDLFTYSFPCTDISNAGLQQGFSKGSGTRSSLLWECERAIRIKRPKYTLMENVKALVSDKFVDLFNEWQNLMAKFGYDCFADVLNSKSFGVPQNRERVFLVGIRHDGEDFTTFHFPKPFPLERRLKDVLEKKVDEKYYLSDEMIRKFTKKND